MMIHWETYHCYLVSLCMYYSVGRVSVILMTNLNIQGMHISTITASVMMYAGRWELFSLGDVRVVEDAFYVT